VTESSMKGLGFAPTVLLISHRIELSFFQSHLPSSFSTTFFVLLPPDLFFVSRYLPL